MKKEKIERVVLAEFDTYDLDGNIDSVIQQLTELRAEGERQGLTNIRLDTDWHEEPVYGYGGYTSDREKIWTTIVVGDKVTPAVFKTKLPKAQYDKAFARGKYEALCGFERNSGADGTREGKAYYEGYDSVKDVHTEHCCLEHGCKYGDDDCPVAAGRLVQSYPCESCGTIS